MSGRKIWMFLSFMALAGIAVAAQQSKVPPPPKPADDGPSLAVTMKFIQDKINDQGKLNYALYVHDNANGSDWIVQKSLEAGNVVSNPVTWWIRYHWNVWDNGTAVQSADAGFSLRDVQDIVVMPLEQEVKQADAKGGYTTRSYKSDPPVFVLMARREKGITNSFYFFDEDMANRVAKAMVHAVELCGGGNKDPF